MEKEILEFFKNAHVFYLATSENGQPHVRPFGAVDLYEGKLYIQTGLVKDCAKQMIANPKVEICSFDGNAWLRLTADAYHDPDVAAETHMLEANPGLKRRYAVGDGNMCVFRLDNIKAYIDSFTAPRKVL